MTFGRTIALGALALLIAAPASAAVLRDGTYNCLTGASAYGNLTTPGQVEIRGQTYRFHESGKPDDQPFAPYGVSGGLIHWGGAMGFMSRGEFSMQATHLDGVVPDSFWWPLLLDGRNIYTVSCRRIG
ncbi:MAG: hypothetical protein WDM91_08310 [Rhizomicrobium sp.]